jgi:SPP1 family predicted phage head-tail adaptor
LTDHTDCQHLGRCGAADEYIAAQAIQSEVTTRVRLRYRPGITSADRVACEGRVYGITSVIDFRSDHVSLF